MTFVSTHTVIDQESGQRLDNFLFTYLKGVPKTRIYRAIRKGEVRINKKRITPEHRLSSGDLIRLPPLRQAPVSTAKLYVSDSLKTLLKSQVLYENERFVVLNKPAGIAVHAGSGITIGVIEAWRLLRPQHPYWELVHRLDRETSGCLLLAKSRESLCALQQLFRAHAITKRYLTLLCGSLEQKKEVSLSLQRDNLEGGERLVKVRSDGKAAKTVFRPKQCYMNSTLVNAELHSGRTHQIRVHAASIGHPVAGDEKYGNKEFNHWYKLHSGKRLFLHAAELAFMDGHQEHIFCAPLPEDLANVLKRITV